MFFKNKELSFSSTQFFTLWHSDSEFTKRESKFRRSFNELRWALPCGGTVRQCPILGYCAGWIRKKA